MENNNTFSGELAKDSELVKKKTNIKDWFAIMKMQKAKPTLAKGIKDGVGLYPVIYDDVRYDASQYMAWAFLKMLGVNARNPDILSHTKCVLHKSRQWEYEKEWRLVDYSTRNYLVENVTSIIYKPTAIYYGVHINQENKERLHSIAKEKGISEFNMYIDYSSPKYEMMCI